jgi:hypothetical protein
VPAAGGAWTQADTSASPDRPVMVLKTSRRVSFLLISLLLSLSLLILCLDFQPRWLKIKENLENKAIGKS